MFVSILISGLLIGVDNECRLVLIPAYNIWPIYFDVTLHPKYPDEPMAALIISMAIVCFFIVEIIISSPSRNYEFLQSSQSVLLHSNILIHT